MFSQAVIVNGCLVVSYRVDADDDRPEATLEGPGQSHHQVDLTEPEFLFQVTGVEISPSAAGSQPGAAQGPPLQIGDGQTTLGMGGAISAPVQAEGQPGVKVTAGKIEVEAALNPTGLDQA